MTERRPKPGHPEGRKSARSQTTRHRTCFLLSKDVRTNLPWSSPVADVDDRGQVSNCVTCSAPAAIHSAQSGPLPPRRKGAHKYIGPAVCSADLDVGWEMPSGAFNASRNPAAPCRPSQKSQGPVTGCASAGEVFLIRSADRSKRQIIKFSDPPRLGAVLLGFH